MFNFTRLNLKQIQLLLIQKVSLNNSYLKKKLNRQNLKSSSRSLRDDNLRSKKRNHRSLKNNFRSRLQTTMLSKLPNKFRHNRLPITLGKMTALWMKKTRVNLLKKAIISLKNPTSLMSFTNMFKTEASSPGKKLSNGLW